MKIELDGNEWALVACALWAAPRSFPSVAKEIEALKERLEREWIAEFEIQEGKRA